MLHRKAKSFEERDEEYDRVKWRIFKESTTAAEPKSTDVASGGDCSETANRSSAHCWPRLGGSDSSEFDGLLESMRGKKSSKGSRLLKVHSLVSAVNFAPHLFGVFKNRWNIPSSIVRRRKTAE